MKKTKNKFGIKQHVCKFEQQCLCDVRPNSEDPHTRHSGGRQGREQKAKI